MTGYRMPMSRLGAALLATWRPWWLGPIVVIIAAIIAMVVLMNPFAPTDAFVYYSAGEQLNAGHNLYSLQPGDTVIAANPPYWTVPLLSPPLIGVLWRPFAALGYTGMLLGWILTAAAFLTALALVARRAPAVTLLIVGALAVPVAWQLMLGNVNGLLALGLVMLWRWRDHPGWAGTLVAFMVAVKVTPVVLAWWLVTTRQWRATGWFLAMSTVLLLVAAVGAGVGTISTYLDVMLHTSTVGTSDLSAAGSLRALGVPAGLAALAPWIVVTVGLGAIWFLRARPRISFAIAVCVLVLGSPVVQHYWYALLIVALGALPDSTRPDLPHDRRGGHRGDGHAKHARSESRHSQGVSTRGSAPRGTANDAASCRRTLPKSADRPIDRTSAPLCWWSRAPLIVRYRASLALPPLTWPASVHRYLPSAHLRNVNGGRREPELRPRRPGYAAGSGRVGG
jgi:Glycosyltransferase family 87